MVPPYFSSFLRVLVHGYSALVKTFSLGAIVAPTFPIMSRYLAAFREAAQASRMADQAALYAVDVATDGRPDVAGKLFTRQR